jgi:hypothetical protein
VNKVIKWSKIHLGSIVLDLFILTIYTTGYQLTLLYFQFNWRHVSTKKCYHLAKLHRKTNVLYRTFDILKPFQTELFTLKFVQRFKLMLLLANISVIRFSLFLRRQVHLLKNIYNYTE